MRRDEKLKGFGNLMKHSLLVFVVTAVLFPLHVYAEPQGKLIIFHAGSLTVPFAKMEKIIEGEEE
jgi:molybdate/tungstate transport system substrate-binding protein